MSCVREASPPLQDTGHLRNDMKKKKFFQPLRVLGKIFLKKGRPVISSSNGSVDAVTATLRSSKDNFESCEQELEATNLEPAKSHSTSHLTDDTTDNSQRRSLQSTLLSVSHDSVFTSEQRSPDSGSETSLYNHQRLGFPHSSVRAELFEVIRKRALENNTSDDEDLGLPRSPVSNSPTTADDMFTKEHIVTKSSQSTCSDGSLLSMGSSEIEEESYCHSSRHSSKLSLHEKRTSSGPHLVSNNDRSSANVSSSCNGTSLSHSAAKHKMAVKPKRNHGAPHKKRQIKTSNTLPTTPEVNEENSHKNLPPEDKQGNCLNCFGCYNFKKRPADQFLQPTQRAKYQREYFYKKNPIYNDTESCRKFLFRHSALHAFKYDQMYDFTKVEKISKCGMADETFKVERLRQVPRCGSKIFTKYRTSHVSLRRTKIEASIRKKHIPKEPRIHNLTKNHKRRNLYEYPMFYYEYILTDLDREAL